MVKLTEEQKKEGKVRYNSGLFEYACECAMMGMNKELVWFLRIFNSVIMLLLCLSVNMPAFAMTIVFVSLCVLRIAQFIMEL